MAFVQATATGVATSSNLDGQFALPAGPQDSLRFSHIGFEPLTVAVADLGSRPVVLQFQVEGMAVAEVVGLTAQTVLDRCMEGLRANHQQRAGYHTGFYRLTGTTGDRYLQISEALLGSDPNSGLVDVLRTRAVRDEGRLGAITFGVSPQTVQEFDHAVFPESFAPFNKKYRKHHRYWLGDTLAVVDGRPAYRLHFDAAADAKKPAWQGVVLVDTATYAVVYIDSNFSPHTDHLRKFGGVATRSALALMGLHISQLTDHTQVRYQRYADGVWRMITVNSTAELDVQNDRPGGDFGPTFRTTYVVTGRTPLDLKRARLGASGLIETTRAEADSSFWEGFAVVAPDVDYAAVAAEIEARNQGHALQQELKEVMWGWPAEREARLDSVVEWFTRETGFYGLVLVAQGDEVLHRSASDGLAVDSAFAIGSIAKTFTAQAVLEAGEQGPLQVDMPVGGYLGAGVPPESSLRYATVRQLLAHRAGLDHGLDRIEVLKALETADSRWEEVSAVVGDPIAEPDAGFRYSNGGYMLAEYVLERATGQSLTAWVDEVCLTPAGMLRTSFPEGVQLNGDESGMYNYNPATVRGAGGMRSTLDDLWKWSIYVQTQLADSVPNPYQLATTPISAYTDWQAGYGLGWMVDQGAFSTSAKHPVIYHPGTEWNSFSMLALQPDRGYTLVLVSLDGAFARYPMTAVLLEVLNGG